MATNLQTIERALRLATILDVEGTATAAMGVIGLKTLNQMLIRWEANNIPLGFTAQTSLAAAIPVPDEALSAVDYNLAVEIAPEFGTSAPAHVVSLANNYLLAVQRDAFIVSPNDLSNMPGARGRWDINSDS